MSSKCERRICLHISSRGRKTNWGHVRFCKQANIKVSITSRSSPIVFRYIPKSQWKEEQSPFIECSVAKSATKTDGRYGGIDWAILRKNGVLPLHKACHNKIAATPLPSFIASSRVLLQEKGGLPKVRTGNVFDLNAYKLMKRSGYNLSKPPLLGSVIEARPHGLNDT